MKNIQTTSKISFSPPKASFENVAETVVSVIVTVKRTFALIYAHIRHVQLRRRYLVASISTNNYNVKIPKTAKIPVFGKIGVKLVTDAKVTEMPRSSAHFYSSDHIRYN